jgi:hypothetical protein
MRRGLHRFGRFPSKFRSSSANSNSQRVSPHSKTLSVAAACTPSTLSLLYCSLTPRSDQNHQSTFLDNHQAIDLDHWHTLKFASNKASTGSSNPFSTLSSAAPFLLPSVSERGSWQQGALSLVRATHLLQRRHCHSFHRTSPPTLYSSHKCHLHSLPWMTHSW